MRYDGKMMDGREVCVLIVFVSVTEKRTLMQASRSIRRFGDLTKCREKDQLRIGKGPQDLKIT